MGEELGSLSGMAGIPVLSEKRASTVVGLEMCQALLRELGGEVGVHVPVRTVPLAWAVWVF